MKVYKSGGLKRIRSREDYACTECRGAAIAVYNHRSANSGCLIAVCTQRHFAWLPRSRENERLINLSDAQGASIEHISRHYEDTSLTKKGVRRRTKSSRELIDNHMRIWPGNASEHLLNLLFPDWMGDANVEARDYGSVSDEVGRESGGALSPD